jgi:DeoR/GlpR family transcriptional regulator of sugar metabolism
MNAKDRRNQIASILLAEETIKIGKIAETFDVSTETIRKDLIFLEKMGIARKKHGHAQVLGASNESNYSYKAQQNIEQKCKIAAEAAKLVPDGATVIIDAGSTTYYFSRQLLLKKDITVITNFMPIGQLMSAGNTNTIIIGGQVQPISQSLTGTFAENALSQLHADFAFLSMSGFAGRQGPCVELFPEAQVKQRMIRSADVCYLLADSSKAHINPLIQFAEWSDFTALISDDQLPEKDMIYLGEHLEVIIAH